MSSVPTVEEVMDLVTKTASTVREDAPLEDVLREMLRDPRTQSVYVVDPEGRLVGIVTMDMALKYLYSEFIPPRYLQFNVSLMEGSNARAKDIMLPPVYVKRSESIEDAFVRMFENHLTEIPVVDEEMHVVGDLHGIELIAKKLKSEGS